jgi:hypothetical protein
MTLPGAVCRQGCRELLIMGRFHGAIEIREAKWRAALVNWSKRPNTASVPRLWGAGVGGRRELTGLDKRWKCARGLEGEHLEEHKRVLMGWMVGPRIGVVAWPASTPGWGP